MRRRTTDLCAFIAVLAAPVALAALDVAPEQILALTPAPALLYTAWRQGGQAPSEGDRTDSSSDVPERSGEASRHAMTLGRRRPACTRSGRSSSGPGRRDA
jgi:hypothetical protein